MSCQVNGQRVSDASRRVGLSRWSSQVGYAVGQAAGAALRLAESVDPPASDAVLGAAVLGATLYQSRDGRNLALNATGAVKLVSAVSGGVGTGLARLSRPADSPVTERFFFKSNTPARFWRSRLTPWFNSGDVGLTSRVTASQGQLIEVEGQAWHYGLTRQQTGQGERTIAHLQNLCWPAQHYYFRRGLSEPEAVGLISGQKGFDPKQLPGYVGQVAPSEGLVPAWAQVKTGLIRATLLWGPTNESSD